jgi:uncharacterized protein (DUF2267 family)
MFEAGSCIAHSLYFASENSGLQRKLPKFVPAPRLVGIEPNPGPSRLTDYQKWKIIFLDEQKNNYSKIAREVGCDRDSVSRILEKFKTTRDVKELEGRGRKRKLSAAEEKVVTRKAKEGKSARKIASESKKTVSEHTIRNILHKHKFFYLPKKRVQRLSKKHREKRIEYATKMMDSDWRSVLFTDEKSFWLGTGKVNTWQQLDHRDIEEFEKYTPKLHVWGSIGYYFKTPLFFFEENMNGIVPGHHLSTTSPKILRSRLSKVLRKKWHFLQDNDPKHKAKNSMVLLRELTGNRIYNHPPNSPDFNVMEDVWSYLDREVRGTKITTIRGLKQKLQQLWKDLPWTKFRPSVNSMRTRLQQCLDRQGARTDY